MRPGRWGALGRGAGPADRGAGRLDRGSGVELGADPLRRDAGLAEDARHGSAGLVQRGQEQMIAGELAAGFPGLLRRVLDEPLRVRRVRRLVATAPRAAPPAARLEAGAHLGQVQTESAQHRLGAAAGTEDREQDVLRADGLVAEAAGFLPRLGQRLLGAGTKGARVDAGCGFGSQSGLASSMSMMGMPSSTA